MTTVIRHGRIVAPHAVTDSYSPGSIIEYDIRKVIQEMILSITGNPDWRTFDMLVRWQDEPVPGLYIDAKLQQDRVDG